MVTKTKICWLVYISHFFETFHMNGVEAAKLRSWTISRPDNTLPSVRFNHGFTGSDDGKLYLFGGINLGGVATLENYV